MIPFIKETWFVEILVLIEAGRLKAVFSTDVREDSYGFSFTCVPCRPLILA